MKLPAQSMPIQFSQPLQQITLMLVAIGLATVGYFLSPDFVNQIFLANPKLNGVICGVFLIGLFACFWQVAQIVTSVIWIEGFVVDEPRIVLTKPPRLLAPLAKMMGPQGARLQLSTSSTRSILDSVASRMDESRDISRYLSNLLIFLGLLGTFVGLAITVPAIVETIRSLSPSEEESGLAAFRRLMTGLQAQLGGMGAAFSSSLFGLAGSLVVGLLDLLAGHGQNRFYRELEEWLSGITRIGLGRAEADADPEERISSSAALAGIMENVGELHYLVEQLLADREQALESLSGLTATIAALTQGIEGQLKRDLSREEDTPSTNQLLEHLIRGQEQMVELLAKVSVDHSDAESRMHLQNIETHLLRLLEENLHARKDIIDLMRDEVSQLAAGLRDQAAQSKMPGEETGQVDREE